MAEGNLVRATKEIVAALSIFVSRLIPGLVAIYCLSLLHRGLWGKFVSWMFVAQIPAEDIFASIVLAALVAGTLLGIISESLGGLLQKAIPDRRADWPSLDGLRSAHYGLNRARARFQMHFSLAAVFLGCCGIAGYLWATTYRAPDVYTHSFWVFLALCAVSLWRGSALRREFWRLVVSYRTAEPT
ncbi:MAG: hypothetical protein KDC35_20680 [Acidobacteria bacterium]|nr:hypothetical protein [Acidobacteriota bacterium]